LYGDHDEDINEAAASCCGLAVDTGMSVMDGQGFQMKVWMLRILKKLRCPC